MWLGVLSVSATSVDPCPILRCVSGQWQEASVIMERNAYLGTDLFVERKYAQEGWISSLDLVGWRSGFYRKSAEGADGISRCQSRGQHR